MPADDTFLTLESQHTALLLIDIQEKLAAVMHDREKLVQGLLKLVAGVQALDIPILWVEQNPTRMGPTIAELHELLTPAYQPVAKMHFSCCGAPQCMDTLRALGRKQILIAGIETHVCVYQTACHLLAQAYQVQVVVDATASRKQLDVDIALRRLQFVASAYEQAIPPLTTVEAALFELMQTAEHPAFRDILTIIR